MLVPCLNCFFSFSFFPHKELCSNRNVVKNFLLCYYHFFSIEQWKIKPFIIMFIFLYTFQRYWSKLFYKGFLNTLANCCFIKIQHIDQFNQLQSTPTAKVLCLFPVRCNTQYYHFFNDKIAGIIYFLKSMSISENVPYAWPLDKIVGAF